MTILIVDDEPPMRVLYRAWFQPFGWDLRLASSGEEALESAEEQRPDATVLDFMMPGGIDGLETAAELRSRGFSEPIFMCSAHVTGSLQERAAAFDIEVFDKSELDALSARLADLEAAA